MHIIAAKAVALGEALTDDFKAYQKQIILNAAELSKDLMAEGFRIVSGGTDNHLMLLDLREFGITGKELENRLDEVHITANKNTIPNDPQSPFITSGVRIGTPAVTTRGFKEDDVRETANLINMVISDFEGNRGEVMNRVETLCKKYPLYE